MFARMFKSLALASLIGIAASGVARADCEDDMAKLDEIMKTPNLTVVAKAILQDAKKKAVVAVKKDDDVTCNKVINEALVRAGIAKK